ncbi:Di-copper centre-containing protein [Meredithblackwellia eburnea MCA 4105]
MHYSRSFITLVSSLGWLVIASAAVSPAQIDSLGPARLQRDAADQVVAEILSDKVSPLLVSRSTSGKCTNPTTRINFEKFSYSQQQTYFKAVKCLYSLPAKEGVWPMATRRYHDLVATHYYHANLTGGTDDWHKVGQFLHIHRAYMAAFESMLRNECGYKGQMAYWPEWKDAGNFENSITLRAHGYRKSGTVTTGPFANWWGRYGPLMDLSLVWNKSVPPSVVNIGHPLWRHIDESYSIWANATQVMTIPFNLLSRLSSLFFTEAFTLRAILELEVTWGTLCVLHPMFFMHHMYLDAIWWTWQQLAPNSRTYDIAPLEFTTMQGKVNMTLDTVLSTTGLIPDLKVRDVADTEGGPL